MNSIKANVINLVFSLLSISGYSQNAKLDEHSYKKLNTKEFKNCEEALQKALLDVKSDSLCWFESKYVNTHDKYYLEDTTLYFKRRHQFDSVMMKKYSIKVIRSSYVGVLPDNTQNCYNGYIMNHMDTAYAQLFILEALNIVRELNGESPEPWEKKKKN